MDDGVSNYIEVKEIILSLAIVSKKIKRNNFLKIHIKQYKFLSLVDLARCLDSAAIKLGLLTSLK